MAESAKTGNEELGDRLRRAREALRMSRRDLADATGLSYPYVSQIETGYRMPSAPAMRSLADALGLRPESLFDAIPPAAPRDAGRSVQPAQALSRATAAVPTRSAPAAPAAPAAAPAPAPRAPVPSAPTGGAPAGAGGAAAAAGGSIGGGWMPNPHFAPPASHLPDGIEPLADAAAAVPDRQDRAVDAATGLLTALPHPQRLAALARVQSRVVQSVIDDGLADRSR